jgi:hypothetical protein
LELSTILEWFSLPLVTAAILAIGGFLLTVPSTSYISGFVQLGFDKKLEEAKAAIRSNEKELEGINTFLVSRQSQRSAAFESKKLEAAEDLVVSLKKFASLSIFAEMMKIIKIEEIKKSSNSTEVKQIFETLSMSYCQIWCLRVVGHAAIWSGFVVSIPSLNVTPVMTFAR